MATADFIEEEWKADRDFRESVGKASAVAKALATHAKARASSFASSRL